MSSTNRPGVVRAEHDHYVTPTDEIEKFLAAAQKDLRDFIKGRRLKILDPAAGEGESYPHALVAAGVYPTAITTMDIRPEAKPFIVGDYLANPHIKQHMKPTLIITNPPFSLAQEFIDKALDDTQRYVAMLLRLNFFGSQKRKPMWDKLMPNYTYVHSKRMSFTADGKTDSIEYMHCVWDKKRPVKSTILRVI